MDKWIDEALMNGCLRKNEFEKMFAKTLNKSIVIILIIASCQGR